MYDTVVIGLGSPLMADDGLGIVAANRAREEWRFTPHVEFVDGGTWGMNVLHLIEGAGAVIFVDAINANKEPGEVIVIQRDALPRFFATKLSPHQIDIKEVIALAEFRGTLPERTVAIGMQPEMITMRSELSDAVTSGLKALTARVVRQLESWGHEATPIEVDANA